MVEKERSPLNYSSSDETKREQRRETDHGHPQGNRFDHLKTGAEQADVTSAEPAHPCIMHRCHSA